MECVVKAKLSKKGVWNYNANKHPERTAFEFQKWRSDQEQMCTETEIFFVFHIQSLR